MYYIRDAELQAQLEEERANAAATDEKAENLSKDGRMKTHLAELLHKKSGNPQDEQDLAELLAILENDKDPYDNIFIGHHGHYTMDDDNVGCNIFTEGTDDYATENLERALEHAAIAKNIFDDQKIYANGSPDLEQQAVVAYAAHLNGLNADILGASLPPPEIQEKMKLAFENMKRKRDQQPAPSPNMQPKQEATSNTSGVNLESSAPTPNMNGGAP